METGYLPSPRFGLRAAVVDNLIYVIGGRNDGNALSSILNWDTVTESWDHAGDLSVARRNHGAVAVPASVVSFECYA